MYSFLINYARFGSRNTLILLPWNDVLDVPTVKKDKARLIIADCEQAR